MLINVDYAWAYLNTMRDLELLSVSSLSALVCHGPHSAVGMRVVVFVPWASFTLTLRSGSSPSPTRQGAGSNTCTKLPKDAYDQSS